MTSSSTGRPGQVNVGASGVDGAHTLKDVKRRFRARLPQGSDSDSLADAWLAAVKQQAIEANLSGGPPPTTLAAVRADILMHVCKQLKRLVSERETEVLLRLSPAAARAVHRQMKSSYEDPLYDYILAWALRDATIDGDGKFGDVRGDRVSFATKDSLDAAVAELTRAGWKVARKRDEDNHPFLIYVETRAGIRDLLSK